MTHANATLDPRQSGASALLACGGCTVTHDKKCAPGAWESIGIVVASLRAQGHDLNPDDANTWATLWQFTSGEITKLGLELSEEEAKPLVQSLRIAVKDFFGGYQAKYGTQPTFGVQQDASGSAIKIVEDQGLKILRDFLFRTQAIAKLQASNPSLPMQRQKIVAGAILNLFR